MRSAPLRDAFVWVLGTKCGGANATFARQICDLWNSNPRGAFLFRLETQQEHAMPYLFWAVLPFALMDTWWGMCEQRRDTTK
jgi:hypothetical protein